MKKYMRQGVLITLLLCVSGGEAAHAGVFRNWLKHHRGFVCAAAIVGFEAAKVGLVVGCLPEPGAIVGCPTAAIAFGAATIALADGCSD
ncbi:MAG TPA: hypothetical protein VGL42_03805 [Opitutaceae bacterium]|jgi:hypothetical protein